MLASKKLLSRGFGLPYPIFLRFRVIAKYTVHLATKLHICFFGTSQLLSQNLFDSRW